MGKFNLSLFGIEIGIPVFEGNCDIEELIAQVAKRKEEKKILCTFLLDRGYQRETSRLEEIRSEALENNCLEEKDIVRYRQPTIDYFLKRLKDKKLQTGLPLYEDLVLRIVEKNGDRFCRKYAELVRLAGKTNVVADIPATFPGAHKQAEAVLVGRLRSDVGDNEIEKFHSHQKILEIVIALARNMFLGINEGLTGEKLRRFMAILYEMENLKVTRPTNERKIKETVLRALKEDKLVNFIHIKCLRFTYPYGNRLKLLEHTGDVEVPTKNGEIHHPLSEEELFVRFFKMKAMFGNYGLGCNFILLVSDQDLHDYFPNDDGEGIVPNSDLILAKKSFGEYQNHIEKIAAGQAEAISLRQYLNGIRQLENFDTIREESLRSLRRGQSQIPDGFLEERVSYRYESNQRIFVKNPGRDFARRRVYDQLASLQALRVLSVIPNLILVEEDRGDENQFIGGIRSSALPVFFMKLRDKLED